MIGSCPTCKKWTELTKHHDKEIKATITLCRDCHNIIEEYVKFQTKTQEMDRSEEA